MRVLSLVATRNKAPSGRRNWLLTIQSSRLINTNKSILFIPVFVDWTPRWIAEV